MNFPKTILKCALSITLIGPTLLLNPLPSIALTVEEVPNPQKDYSGWVTDMAEILSQSTENQLNQMISELEAQNGSEIAVVTVPETQPATTPKEFATKLFNYWGIGKKDQNNGVLFLVSVGDRRVEIDTGKGIQKILPDTKVSNIIDAKIIPEFKSGQFESGIVVGTTELVASLKPEKNIKKMEIGIIVYIIFSLLLLVIVINSIWRANRRSNTVSNTSSNRGGYRRNNNLPSSSSRSSSSNSRSSSDSSSYFGGYDSGSCGGDSSYSAGSSDSSGSSFGGGSSDGGGDGGSW